MTRAWSALAGLAFGFVAWGTYADAGNHPGGWAAGVGLALALLSADRGRYLWRAVLAPLGGAAFGLGLGGDAGGALAFGLAFALAFALYARALRARRERRLVARHGVPANATVLAVEETKKRVNGHPVLRLSWQVEPPEGEPFETTRDLIVPRGSEPRPGDRFPVLVHADDPSRWALADA